MLAVSNINYYICKELSGERDFSPIERCIKRKDNQKMTSQFSPKVSEVLAFSREEATRLARASTAWHAERKGESGVGRA